MIKPNEDYLSTSCNMHEYLYVTKMTVYVFLGHSFFWSDNGVLSSFKKLLLGSNNNKIDETDVVHHRVMNS